MKKPDNTIDDNLQSNNPPELDSLPNASEIQVIATDADNNLWDWVGMHALGMKEMAGKISFCTGIPYEKVRASMKRVYTAAKTLDYSKLVESMDVIQELIAKHAEKHLYTDPRKTEQVRMAHATHEMVDLVDAARRAYDYSKEKTFRLYPGIREVFQLVAQNRVKIVILTDAPSERTIRRLKKFNLQNLIAKMFGQDQAPLQFDKEVKFAKDETGLRPFHDAIKEAIPYLGDYTHTAQVGMGLYEAPFPVVIMKPDERKPDIDLARRFGATSEDVKNKVAVWGDNPEKDIQLAVNNECTGFYSSYGQNRDPNIADILRQFGSTQVVSRNLSAGEEAFEKLRKNSRSKLVQLAHPIQILDCLDIGRPGKFRAPKKK